MEKVADRPNPANHIKAVYVQKRIQALERAQDSQTLTVEDKIILQSEINKWRGKLEDYLEEGEDLPTNIFTNSLEPKSGYSIVESKINQLAHARKTQTINEDKQGET